MDVRLTVYLSVWAFVLAVFFVMEQTIGLQYNPQPSNEVVLFGVTVKEISSLLFVLTMFAVFLFFALAAITFIQTRTTYFVAKDDDSREILTLYHYGKVVSGAMLALAFLNYIVDHF